MFDLLPFGVLPALAILLIEKCQIDVELLGERFPSLAILQRGEIGQLGKTLDLFGCIDRGGDRLFGFEMWWS